MITQTTPLAKAITTLEGQLVVVTDVVLAVGASLDPHLLPPKWAAITATVMNVALLAQRALVKVHGTPIQGAAVPVVDTDAALLAEVEAKSGGAPTE